MAAILYLALIMAAGVQADQTDEQELIRESREQAQYYVGNILNRQNVPENVWALAALADAHPLNNRYIAESLQELQSGPGYFQIFSDTTATYGQKLYRAMQETGSPQLLIAYLLDEKDPARKREAVQAFEFPEPGSGTDYEELVRRLLDQEPLDEQIFPPDEITLTHFLLFYYSAGRNIMPEELTEAIAANPVDVNITDRSLPLSLEWLSIFNAQYETDQYSRAMEYYNLLSEDDLLPNSKFRLNIYRMLDFSMYQLGNYDRSLEIIRNFTLPLSAFFDQPAAQQEIHLMQGISLYQIGKIEEAQDAYLEVMRAAEEMGVAGRYQTILFNNLALTYLKSGNFDQYLNLQHRAYEMADSTGNYENQFAILRNLFIYHRDNRNADLALVYLDNAREIAEQNNDTQNLALIDLYAGSFYKNITEEYGKAGKHFEQAAARLSENENYIQLQELKFEQARLMELENNYRGALGMYNELIKMASNQDNPRNFLEASVKKADAHLMLGRVDSAAAGIAVYTASDLNILFFDQLILAKTVQARYLSQTGNTREAIEILDPVIDQIVNWVRESTDLQSGFWNVEPEFLEAFRMTANLHIETGNPGKAVMVLDQLKSINDAALYQNPLVRSRILSESELTQYQRITGEMDQLRKQLLSSAGENQTQVQQKLDQLNARKRVMDRQISAASYRDPISLRSVQNRLSAYERVLHITELDNRYYIATISRSEVEFRTVPLDSLNRRLFERSIQQVAEKETDLNNLYEIARILGLHRMDSRIRSVTVIPDSYLYQLPLDILPVTPPQNPFSYGEATYLVEQVETRYLTSLNDFQKVTDDRTYKSDFAGFGISSFEEYDDRNLVPLPFARREVINISRSLNNFRVRETYLDTASTEQHFNRVAPDSRILHLATHSQVSDQDPLFSRFYMSRPESDGGDEFPGQIFAYELFELNLNNDLIMLNSCESGSGSYLQGSGVMGISRALRYAGASTLVLNLWSVNDMMASEFAVHFYEGLNAGQSKAEALRNTKLHFLKEKNGNPHFWGPYMMLGDVEALVKPEQPVRNMVAGTFMIYFIIIVTASLFIRKRSA